jgi:hypothetical protein
LIAFFCLWKQISKYISEGRKQQLNIKSKILIHIKPTTTNKNYHTFETIEEEVPCMSRLAVEAVRDEIVALEQF